MALGVWGIGAQGSDDRGPPKKPRKKGEKNDTKKQRGGGRTTESGGRIKGTAAYALGGR